MIHRHLNWPSILIVICIVAAACQTQSAPSGGGARTSQVATSVPLEQLDTALSESPSATSYEIKPHVSLCKLIPATVLAQATGLPLDKADELDPSSEYCGYSSDKGSDPRSDQDITLDRQQFAEQKQAYPGISESARDQASEWAKAQITTSKSGDFEYSSIYGSFRDDGKIDVWVETVKYGYILQVQYVDGDFTGHSVGTVADGQSAALKALTALFDATT